MTLQWALPEPTILNTGDGMDTSHPEPSAASE
jgi:hypothetical protein